MTRRILASGLAAAPLLLFGKGSLANEFKDAPFGLTWGVSEIEIRQKGVELAPAKGNDFGISFMATNLPRAISDLETTQLSFGFDDKLWRVAAISREFGNDPYGASVRMRYDALVDALRKKYGQGDQSHFQDTEMWKNADDFLMGIKQGRSWHFTNFDTASVSVEISVRALSSDTGYIVLIYTEKSLERAFKAKKGSSEEKAL